MVLKIGVIGAGHFGKVHLNCLNQSNVFELIGFFDVDPHVSQQIAKEYNLNAFNSVDELIEAVDVVDVVTPATGHFQCIKKALDKNKHVFVEKPMAVTNDQAEQIRSIVLEKGLKFQIGHVERFNPSFIEAKSYINNVEYIETNRHSIYNNRNTDVSVVHDLMIHDIDILLNLVESKIVDVRAKGFSLICDDIDIVNARIEFANGCVANLNASRIASENSRKSLFYSKDSLLTIDFNKKETLLKVVEKSNTESNNQQNYAFKTNKGENFRFVDKVIETKPVNAVVNELVSFCNSIINDTIPEVSVNDGYKAVKLANKILDQVNKKS